MPRYIRIDDKSKCCGCSVCISACPAKCIAMQPGGQGCEYPVVDVPNCVDCGICSEACPCTHSSPRQEWPKPHVVVAWNRDPKTRRDSSSGGAFTALAKAVLAGGGMVYGAAFTSDFRRVQHLGIENISDLAKLRGSKYVQSSMEGVPEQIREHTRRGRKVLFVGAPCQVAGLRRYIGNTGNLITCDFICHGVPAPEVFDKYVSEQNKKYGAETVSLNFRHKKSGWNFIEIDQRFANGKRYHKWASLDPYMAGFFGNVFLQTICYNCTYNAIPRVAEITIADAWRIAAAYPEYDDNEGTSVLLANSPAGQALLETAGDYLEIRGCERYDYIASNVALQHAAKIPPTRDQFFSALSSSSFHRASRVYLTRKERLRGLLTGSVKRLFWWYLRHHQ